MTLPTNFGTAVINPQAAGAANYAIASSFASVDGVLQANFRYVIRALTAGNFADMPTSLNVAVHYFASNSVTLPANASTVAVWAPTAEFADLLPNRTPLSGYTYLRTVNMTLNATYKPQVQSADNSATVGDVVYEAKAEHYIPRLLFVNPGDRQRIIAVLVTDNFVNNHINQPLQAGWTVTSRSA